MFSRASRWRMKIGGINADNLLVCDCWLWRIECSVRLVSGMPFDSRGVLNDRSVDYRIAEFSG